RWRGQKDVGPKVSNNTPLPPYQLTPNPLPVRLPRQGAPLPHGTPHPRLQCGSSPKPSHMARFSTFGLKTTTPAGATKRATPLPPPPHTHHPTTSPLRPAPPFLTARP